MELKGIILLAFLTTVNLLIYVDRGAIAGLLYRLKEDESLDLSDTEAGLLGSAFMFGFMITSPLFAYSLQYISIKYLLLLGCLIWATATLTVSISRDYWMLLMARTLTGVGEAPICPLIPPLIIKIAPQNNKSVRST